MPELPEVQTTVKGLQVLIHNQISNVKINSTKIRYDIPKDIKKILKNNRFIRIYRIGKYILFDLNNNYSLIIHLGMSGRLQIIRSANLSKKKHNHIILSIKNKKLLFNDPRKFGFVDIRKTKEIHNIKYIKVLGIDALDKKINTAYIKNKIGKSVVPIKQILLNQRIISGIGNIYASEILYDAKISPFVSGFKLNDEEITRIIKSIRKILIKAINAGGSTLRDYSSSDGTLGNFQKYFKVYGKEGCKVSGKEIKRIIQYGRSTFFCPEVQFKKNKKKL